MRQVSSEQIKIIHVLLSRIGHAGDKEFKVELVQGYTDSRETSTKGLTYQEAAAMIADLNKQITLTPEQIKANAKRRLILSYAHQMGWEDEKGKVDMSHLNSWCEEYGYLHKPLNDYTLTELSKLVYQAQQAYKAYLMKV